MAKIARFPNVLFVFPPASYLAQKATSSTLPVVSVTSEMKKFFLLPKMSKKYAAKQLTINAVVPHTPTSTRDMRPVIPSER